MLFRSGKRAWPQTSSGQRLFSHNNHVGRRPRQRGAADAKELNVSFVSLFHNPLAGINPRTPFRSIGVLEDVEPSLRQRLFPVCEAPETELLLQFTPPIIRVILLGEELGGRSKAEQEPGLVFAVNGLEFKLGLSISRSPGEEVMSKDKEAAAG